MNCNLQPYICLLSFAISTLQCALCFLENCFFSLFMDFKVVFKMDETAVTFNDVTFFVFLSDTIFPFCCKFSTSLLFCSNLDFCFINFLKCLKDLSQNNLSTLMVHQQQMTESQAELLIETDLKRWRRVLCILLFIVSRGCRNCYKRFNETVLQF